MREAPTPTTLPGFLLADLPKLGRKGNAAVYCYSAEEGGGIDQAAAHEANRTPRASTAQIYLKTIQYGTSSPTSPTGRHNRRRQFPRTGCSSSSSATETTPPYRQSRGLTGPGRSARPVLHLSRQIRGPYLPVGPAVPVLQQLPRRADGGPRLPRPLARPCLLRPAGARRSPQPRLHLPRLGDPDRIPPRLRRHRHPVDAAARIRKQPAADPAVGPDSGSRQPGQPAGRGWVAAVTGGSTSTPKASPESSAARTGRGTTSGTPARTTWSRSRTGHSWLGSVSSRCLRPSSRVQQTARSSRIACHPDTIYAPGCRQTASRATVKSRSGDLEGCLAGRRTIP